MGTLERQPSIDSEPPMVDIEEPPTLNHQEMKRAREEAMRILKTLGPEEALKYFTQGLKLKADKVNEAKTVDVANTAKLDEESKPTENSAVIFSPPPPPPATELEE